MSGWVEVVTGGNFQVTGNKLVGETQSGNGGTNGGGIYKDYGLGTFDNSKFVLRCKYQILVLSQVDQVMRVHYISEFLLQREMVQLHLQMQTEMDLQ